MEPAYTALMEMTNTTVFFKIFPFLLFSVIYYSFLSLFYMDKNRHLLLMPVFFLNFFFNNYLI